MKTRVFPEQQSGLAAEIPPCPELSSGQPITPVAPVIKNETNTLIWYDVPEDGRRVVHKTYHHRGLFNFIRQKIFFFRVQREYNALAFLARKGISCSEPLFWSYGYQPRLGFFETLATREIPDAVTIMEYYQTDGNNAKDIDLAPIFQIVREMHRTGFHHGALYPRNIMMNVGGDGKRNFYMIDTPKAVIFSGDTFGTRMSWFDLLDLCRELILFIEPDSLTPLLRQYGFKDKLIYKFRDRLGDYNTRKKIRKVIRGEFILRSFFQ